MTKPATCSRKNPAIQKMMSDCCSLIDYKCPIAPVYFDRDCSRCGGEGYGHFLGPDRAPGQCFGCGGKGRRLRNGRAMELASAAVGLDGYREAWKIAKNAEAIAVLTADKRRVARELVRLERGGKSLAETVTRLGGEV